MRTLAISSARLMHAPCIREHCPVGLRLLLPQLPEYLPKTGQQVQRKLTGKRCALSPVAVIDYLTPSQSELSNHWLFQHTELVLLSFPSSLNV